MALFQPTNITPDLKGGTANGVVYVPANPSTDTIAVSWTVNGNSALVAYQIDFYKNDTASTFVISTGKVTLGTPFSAISADGTETQFSVNLLYSYFGQTAALSTPKEGKFQITQWWGATDDESVVQKSASVFRLTRHSTLTVSGPTETDGNYIFSGTFTPPGSGYGDVVLNWTRWYATFDDINGNSDIVRDTGKVWGATAYTWTISGLCPGDYEVVFEGQTSDGEYIYAFTTFTALPDAIQVPFAPINFLCDRSKQAVGVQAQISKDILGAFNGTVTVDGDFLSVDTYSTAKWTIPATLTTAPWSFVWRGKFNSDSDPIFQIMQSNGVSVEFGYDYSGQEFYCDPVFSDVYSLQVDLTSEYIIGFSMGTTALTKNRFYWYVTEINSGGTVAWGTSGIVSNTYVQKPVTEIILLSGKTKYWKLSYGTANNNIAEAWTNGTDPIFYGLNVGFPKNFDTTMQNAVINYFGDDTSNVEAYLYRMENGTTLRYIGNPFSFGEQDYTPVIYDYSAVNNKDYMYSVIVRYPTQSGENVIYLESDGVVNPCFWAWALIEAEPSGIPGVYQTVAVYLFSSNVSTSEMPNGNARNLFSTFTRYPVVMRNSQNRRNGNLSGLIGSVAAGVYTDSNATMDALYALSTSQNALFLRSRRGEFMQIAPAGDIKMDTVDNTAKQQVTASIPWVEIADASTISVVDSSQ